MGHKLLLGAQAVLLATTVGLTLPGCFTVGDDDSGDAGSSGQSGDTGKGGSGGSSGSSSAGKGGSGGTGGSGATGGSTSPTCVPTGQTCTQNGDCCSFNQSNGYCVGGVCADGCEFDSDCAGTTGCCAELQSGGLACGPAEICAGSCVEDDDTCSVNSDCCSYAAGEGYCISQLGSCVPSCMGNDECDTGCCVALEGLDDGACAPAAYCE